MGYETKSIAKITQPAEISLAGNPNFVEFESLQLENLPEKYFIDITLYIRNTGFQLINNEDGNVVLEWPNPNPEPPDKLEKSTTKGFTLKYISNFVLKEVVSGQRYPIKGKFTPDQETELDYIFNPLTIVEDLSEDYSIFHLDSDIKYFAENIVNTLKNKSFFEDNFDISVQEDYTIRLVAKKEGQQYDFELENEPNDFIKLFSQKKSTLDEPVDFKLKLTGKMIDIGKSSITFTDSSAKEYRLSGTKDKTKVNGSTYFIDDEDASITVENIKSCLMREPHFRNNYHISIPLMMDGYDIVNGETIHIQAKSLGEAYIFQKITFDEDVFKLEGNYRYSRSNDSILRDSESCEIQLDVYKDNGLFPGEGEYDKWGTYITTLSKSYFGKPLWFDLNTLYSNQNKYSTDCLIKNGWCNAGTVSDFRFAAKRFDGVSNETFFLSNPLYVITGNIRALEPNDLSPYILDGSMIPYVNKIRPFTNQPVLTHIKGQKQFFNFILSDKDKQKESEIELGIMYKLYTQSGSFIGKVIDPTSLKNIKTFDVVNTIGLQLDEMIDMYPKTGRIDVYLCSDGNIFSEPQTYMILPSHLYKLNDFAFLNSLGGWSSFNFGGQQQTDFKTNATTIYKTHTPELKISDSIETVFGKNPTEHFIVQTMPIKANVADWLKELSSSVAVYELATQRYIIVDELNIKHNDKDDLFTLQMKYHYSDSHNAE